MNLSNKELHVTMFDSFGPQDVNVTLMVVIVQIFNQLMTVVGSGQVQVPKLDQLANAAQVIGVIQEDIISHNQTIVKRPKEMMNHVCQFSIISIMTV